MFSTRCKRIVESELEKLGLYGVVTELGQVKVSDNITSDQREQLKIALLKSGLELMDENKAILIEKIKIVIEEMILDADNLPKINFSEFLTKRLPYDYTYLANLFSEVTGITIEHYIISLKIETVKDLLIYENLNLTQISYKLNYSSVAHLSSQFKKVTGLTASFFIRLIRKKHQLLSRA